MSQDLRTELKTYMSYLDTQAPAVSVDDIAPAIVPVAHPALNRRRGWLIAAAAAALTVVVVGGIAWLAPFSGQTPPAAEDPTPTTVELPPTTEAAVTTDTVPATTTTLAGIPSVPPGEGPKLSFVQAEAPTDGELRGGEWFRGALYVLSSDGGDSQQLFRSTDGFTWELVPGLPEASDIRHSMLQTDGDRLINVVMPVDGNRGIAEDASIQVNTSTNGADWVSSRIELPIPIGSNMAGEFQLGNGFLFSDNFAVGPKGIVVIATINLVFESENFANSLVDPDAGIHVEIVDLDLGRNVMVVRFLDEENDMKQIGDLREIDLEAAGFSNAFSNLLDAMAADSDWEPLIPGFLAQLTGEDTTGLASASVGYAWFSPDGVDWLRIDSTGPLDGGEFVSIVATPDGFVAIASSPYRPSELPPEMRYLSESFDSSVVWQSADGTTWTEATDLTTRHGFDTSRLVEWQGEPIEQVGWAQRRGDDTKMWTLAEPVRGLFSEIPTDGMLLEISEFGLIGTPTYGWEDPGKMEILFSADGTNWSRWEPVEFGQGDAQAEAWILGVGNDFVVVQLREWDEASASSINSLWVGTVP